MGKIQFIYRTLWRFSFADAEHRRDFGTFTDLSNSDWAVTLTFNPEDSTVVLSNKDKAFTGKYEGGTLLDGKLFLYKSTDDPNVFFEFTLIWEHLYYIETNEIV